MEEGYYSDSKGCRCFVKIGVGWKDNRAIDFCSLHAAAGELLEACNALIDCQREKEPTAFNMLYDRAVQNARTAIAKAE